MIKKQDLPECPVATTVNLVGGKWKLLILRNLLNRPYRFNELQDILFKVNRLKRKYGYTMERINEYRIELIEKIDNIKHRDEYIHSLQKEQKEIK